MSGPGVAGRLKRMGVMLAVPLLAVAAWVGAHHLPHAEPEPVFSVSALPALAADSSNGVALLEERKSFLEGLEVPREFELEHLEEAADPAAREAFCGPDRATELASLLRQATARDAYVDRCQPSFGSTCEPMLLVRAHRAAVALAVCWFQRGEKLEALKLAAAQLGAEVKLLRSARGLLAHAIAGKNSVETAQLVAKLVRALPAQEGSTEEQVRVLAGLRQMLESADVDAVTAERAVAFEYLQARSALKLITSGDQTPWLLDRHQTLAVLDADFRLWRAFALDDKGPRPPAPRRLSDGTLWWAWNPVGKIFLDAVRMDLGEHLQTFRADVARFKEERQALLTVLPAPE